MTTDIDQGQSILVVDAAMSAASAVSAALGAEYLVISVTSAEQALAILRERSIGVMLCSEYLEDENGLVFMSRIRGQFPLLQPILMSEGITEDLLTYAINDIGVLKYLKKPLEANQLRDAVQAAQRHYQQAVDIDNLRDQYQDMTRQMRGLPYRIRRFRRSVRVMISHSRDFLMASATTIVAINGLFLGLGIIVLGLLYTLKSLLGINVLADMHLQDLLF